MQTWTRWPIRKHSAFALHRSCHLRAAAVFRPPSVAAVSSRFKLAVRAAVSHGTVSRGQPSVAGRSQSRAAVSRGPQSVTGRSQSQAAVSHGPQSVAGRSQSRAVVSRGQPPVTGSSGQSLYGPHSVTGSSGQ
jgi:hypothetical protein